MSVIDIDTGFSKRAEEIDQLVQAKKKPDFVGDLKAIEDLSLIAIKSNHFPELKSASQAMLKLKFGQDLGITSLAALSNIYIFDAGDGPKIVIGVHILASKIKESGKYNYKIIEYGLEKCVIQFYEKGFLGSEGWEVSGPAEVYTIEDAKRAGLADKKNWRRLPAEMLYARCLARGQRKYCPDVMGATVYVHEEMDTFREQGAIEAVVVETPVAGVGSCKKTSGCSLASGHDGFCRTQNDRLTIVDIVPDGENRGHGAENAPSVYSAPSGDPHAAVQAIILECVGGDLVDAQMALELAIRQLVPRFAKAKKVALEALSDDEALSIHRAIAVGEYSVSV